MTPNITGMAHRLRNPHAHGFRRGSVLVRSSRTEHNVHKRRLPRTSTPVSLGGWGIGTLILRIRYHIIERRVEAATRATQPLDSYVHLPPLLLKLSLSPLGDAAELVMRAAIPEVKTRPAHGGSLA